MTWGQSDRRVTLQTESQCLQLDIFDDRNIFPPERQWRQCRSRWIRSQCERTCWVSYDRSLHCPPQWSHHWHTECLTVAPGSTPSLEQRTQPTLSSYWLHFSFTGRRNRSVTIFYSTSSTVSPYFRFYQPGECWLTRNISQSLKTFTYYIKQIFPISDPPLYPV